MGVRSGNPRTVRVPKGYDVGFAPYNFERLTQSRDVDVDKLLLQKNDNRRAAFSEPIN